MSSRGLGAAAQRALGHPQSPAVAPQTMAVTAMTVLQGAVVVVVTTAWGALS